MNYEEHMSMVEAEIDRRIDERKLERYTLPKWCTWCMGGIWRKAHVSSVECAAYMAINEQDDDETEEGY